MKMYADLQGNLKNRRTKSLRDNKVKFSEYGSSHEPARPWMRPAFDESKEEAYAKIEGTAMDGIEQSFKK